VIHLESRAKAVLCEGPVGAESNQRDTYAEQISMSAKIAIVIGCIAAQGMLGLQPQHAVSASAGHARLAGIDDRDREPARPDPLHPPVASANG
jgi:hypothetical protein